MATDYTVDGARVGIDGASSITWQAVCDLPVNNWDKANQAIVAATAASGSHTPLSESFKIRWRNFTDSGSFADLVTGSGELRAGTSAGCITNTDPVGANCGCHDVGLGDTEECENESPLQTASLNANTKDYSIEVQVCVDFSNALGGKRYDFELYSVTESVSVGLLDVSITTEVILCEPQTDSRIADASASWQGVCDLDITSWDKSNHFILSTYATGGNGDSKAFKLQWKESGGSFADVTEFTEIGFNANTVLVDGNSVANPAGCLTSTKSEENEGNNSALLDSMGISDVGEIQWALNPGGAQDDTTYEFQLVCTTDTTSEVCSCSITTQVGATTAYKDVALKTSLESNLTYKDVALKTTIESIPNYKDITLKTSFDPAPSLAYKDITVKTTLESISIYKDIALKTTIDSLNYKDITLKTSFSSAPSLGYKDITLKTTLESIPIYKDITLKTTLESIPIYKDVALKTTLNLLGYKDVALKTSLELGQTLVYKDIILKTTLESALTYKDIALKTSLHSLDYKDITVKTTLDSLVYKDISLKVSLESEATVDYKDITLKTSITSNLTYKDITLKTTLESIPIYKDILIKTSLESISIYKNVVLKVSLESSSTYKDIAIKTSLESAPTYKNVVLKTTFDSLTYKDIALKTTLNYLEFKDVALKISLVLGEVMGYKDISLKTSLDYYLVCFKKQIRGKIIKKEISGKLISKQKIYGKFDSKIKKC